MEPSQGTTERKGGSCGECSTPNLPGANFCKACGASIAAPSKCPKCEVDVPQDAKFCSSCGTKLVGARPAPTNGTARAEAKSEPKPKKDPLAAEKAKLPPPKKPSSNMTTNVVLFVALILGLGTVIYAMNKDKPKEVSPFSGGPPPGMSQRMNQEAAPPPAAAAADAVPSGDPVEGQITVDASLGDPGSGTIFIVVRNQGMPNQGPPLAVKRIADPKFPASFQISASDMMMPGIPFVGPFDIYARLDRDGNAMTKDPGDLVNSAPAAGVKAGSKDVQISLDKKL
jgi:hypothetical protein